MASIDLQSLKNSYEQNGFVSGIRIVNTQEAAEHRQAMEWAESEIGPLHYRTKVHTILRSPLQLATLPGVLDIVEQLIGPDILLYNVTYIVKEGGSSSHVSWHQDLTYWGLSHDDQVSMWLALSAATETSGCMRMIPGSHVQGHLTHELTNDEANVLFQGQTVQGVEESEAELCPLESGEASFHHGWTLHASLPNKSQDRRIGINVQYFAAHVRQTKHNHDSAMLVRGEDRYNHFLKDTPAGSDLDPAALARQRELEAQYQQIAGTT